MIAVDTNILVYAHREDSSWHDPAYRCIQELAQASAPWGIPYPCVHEFLAIVTHARIYDPPTPLKAAIDQVAAWLEVPNVHLISESEGYWPRLQSVLIAGRVSGAQVHDARVAALCLHHGVDELWSADRDFSRFPELRLRNPLI